MVMTKMADQSSANFTTVVSVVNHYTVTQVDAQDATRNSENGSDNDAIQ